MSYGTEGLSPERYRTEAFQFELDPVVIVVTDVSTDAFLELFDSIDPGQMEELGFQRTREAFHGRVVQTVALGKCAGRAGDGARVADRQACDIATLDRNESAVVFVATSPVLSNVAIGVQSLNRQRLDVKKRFTKEQIIGFLREVEAGLSIKELCRKHGFSEASYDLWRSKFGNMSVPEVKIIIPDALNAWHGTTAIQDPWKEARPYSDRRAGGLIPRQHRRDLRHM